MSARIGELLNASDIARNIGVDTTTLQSWMAKLEQNALVRILRPYFSNLNQRLIKTPKLYFEDIGLACRFQGWTEFHPLYLSSQFGHLVENLALIEITRFFQNRVLNCEVFFVRSKEKVEVDFLVKLPNNRWLAIEVKTTPIDYTDKQLALLDSLQIDIIDRWTVTLSDREEQLKKSRVLPIKKIGLYLESFF